jgi:hypothetical protein
VLASLILPKIPPGLKELQGKRWTLLYRASHDGFMSSVIETTKRFIFGGSTPVAWDSSGSYKSDASQRSFLFTVKNSHGPEGRTFSIATQPM